MDKKATKRYFRFASEANRDAALRKQADEVRAANHKAAMERRERNGLAWAIVAERTELRSLGLKPNRENALARIKAKALSDIDTGRGARVQAVAWQRLNYIEATA
jgi:hypothetical protein